jgi:hypothetical protein
MPIDFPNVLSPSGLTPQGFMICQLILVFHPFLTHQTVDSLEFTRVFFRILRDLHLMTPLFSRRDLIRINMFGAIVKVLALRLCRSPQGKIHPGLLVSLVRRLVNRKIFQVDILQLQRLLFFSSYVSISEIPPPVTVYLDDKILSVFQSSKNCGDNFLFLLSKLPDPCALQSLVSSDNEDLQFAILCMVFRELDKNRNQLFLSIYYNDYWTSRRLFFRQSRSRSFRELNFLFRILKRTFRNQLRPGMSHFDFIDWIYARFFQFMKQASSKTWQFIRRAFSERSLEALCDFRETYREDEENLKFDLHYPGFNQIPDAVSFLRKVNSLHLTPELIDRLRRKSIQHYDESWKSILACGLFWIVSFTAIIQHGDSFLNYIFNYVIHARDDSMYVETLELFLDGATGSEHSRFQEFLYKFNTMRGRYIDLERDFSLAEVIDGFVKILDDPQFFSELHRVCMQDINEERFLQLSSVLRNSRAHHIFERWFYPRVYVICTYCKIQIHYSRHLKSIKACEHCAENHSLSLWSDDDD